MVLRRNNLQVSWQAQITTTILVLMGTILQFLLQMTPHSLLEEKSSHILIMKNNSIPLQQSKDVMTYPPHIDSIAESHQSQNSHVLGQIIILQNDNKKSSEI
jgi:hypothetical protein